MAYVDGFVLPVPKKNLRAYERMAREAGAIWLEHGALEYHECVGDDLEVKMGLPFPRLVKPRRGETVVFSWITYRSRAHRDRVTAKVMKDPRLASMPKQMPFDVKRMAYGGFEPLVELRRKSTTRRGSRRPAPTSRRSPEVEPAETPPAVH